MVVVSATMLNINWLMQFFLKLNSRVEGENRLKDLEWTCMASLRQIAVKAFESHRLYKLLLYLHCLFT